MSSNLDLLNKFLPVAIVGMGLSGDAVLKMLLAAGVPRGQIKTFDGKIKADFSDAHKLIYEFKPKCLAISPGVPLSTSWIQDFKNSGGIITSELELATYFLESEIIISITGSLGKSTTTALIYEGARKVDPHSFIGGNFGFPLASYISRILNGGERAKFVILELSSFQLENYSNLKSRISLLTFLSANHLERYSSIDEYFKTKFFLLDRTQEIAFFNSRGGQISEYRGYLENRFHKFNLNFIDRDHFKKFEKRLPRMLGEHNLDNLSLAYAVGQHLHWPEESFEAMLKFPGLPHRLENCGTYKGVLFLNDSKSTTIDSVLEAVQSVTEQNLYSGKIHLLLGGRDKNLPWENLQNLKSSKFNFHFFGEYGQYAKMKSLLEGDVWKNLETCLKNLKGSIVEKDVVLLSPGGTSLDEFSGFEDRGNFFKNWVQLEFNN